MMKIGDLVRETYSDELCIIVEVVTEGEVVGTVEEIMFIVHFCQVGDREIAWEFDLKPLDGEVFNKKINKILDKSPERDTLLIEPEQRVSP